MGRSPLERSRPANSARPAAGSGSLQDPRGLPRWDCEDQPPSGPSPSTVRSTRGCVCAYSFVQGNGHILASTKAHGWTRMHAGRARQGERDLRPPEVANASVNAGVDTGSVSVSPCWRMQGSIYPDWAKVGASDSAPSDGSTLGETAIGERNRLR